MILLIELLILIIGAIVGGVLQNIYNIQDPSIHYILGFFVMWIIYIMEQIHDSK